MGEVLVNVLPVSVAAALLPVWIILVLFLLLGKGGWRTAAAFVGGAIVVRLVQGILLGRLFGAAEEAHGQEGEALIASALFLVLGILMLIVAVKKWRKEEDADDPPPKWMTMLGEIKPWQAFGAGALLMLVAVKQWVFLLTALGAIGETGPTLLDWVLGYLFFLVVSFSLMTVPIIVYALAPVKSAQVLGRLQAWLARYNRVIAIGVSLLFGLWFLYKGVTGLIG